MQVTAFSASMIFQQKYVDEWLGFDAYGFLDTIEYTHLEFPVIHKNPLTPIIRTTDLQYYNLGYHGFNTMGAARIRCRKDEHNLQVHHIFVVCVCLIEASDSLSTKRVCL